MKFKKSLISLELNELNFDWIVHYTDQGKLPNFNSFIKQHGLIKTSSEKDYESLEPWIQWPSFYYSAKLKDHKIFHLGDRPKLSLKSIYNKLSLNKKNFLAISPMNCDVPISKGSVYFSDPWNYKVFGTNKFDGLFWKSISNLVNTNSAGKGHLKSYFYLIVGFIRYFKVRNALKYLYYLLLSFNFKWAKAIFLEMLLFDFSLRKMRDGNFFYTSIFLNAGAHIQHHYLFDSACYMGKERNPHFYSGRFSNFFDPLYEIYSLYDSSISHLIKLGYLSSHQLLITTGLTQIPNKNPYFQYRLNDHKKFLDYFKVDYLKVSPKMSRDFYLYFDNKESLKIAAALFSKFQVKGQRLFTCMVDNRELKIFVQLSFRKKSYSLS